MSAQINLRLVDYAKVILQSAPLTKDEKALAWDHFHDARDSEDLTGRLANVAMSDDIKAALVDAKKFSDPDPFDKAIARMSKCDPKLLDLCEKYQTVLNVLASEAVKE